MTMAISVRSLPIVLEPPYRRVGDIDPDSGRDGDRLPVDEDVQVGVDVVYSCGSGVRPAALARSIGSGGAGEGLSFGSGAYRWAWGSRGIGLARASTVSNRAVENIAKMRLINLSAPHSPET